MTSRYDSPQESRYGSSVVAPKTTPVSTSPKSYFYGETPGGGTIGRSDELDTSGRPLLGYRTPGATATTTDQTRVATTFDPRVAQPLTHDQYYNPRADGLRQQFLSELGIQPSDELDHAIALTVGGSNQKENLRAVPKDQNRAAGEFELDLARKLKAGQISYFDAQVADAKRKGIPVPYTGQLTEPQKRGLEFAQAGENVKKAAVNIGEFFSGILPGVRAITDSIVTKSFTPEKEFLKTVQKRFDYRGLTEKGPDGKMHINEQRFREVESLAAGFVGGAPGAGEAGAAGKISSTAKAFEKSSEHKVVGKIGEKDAVIGTFGKNAIERKVSSGQGDRLPIHELPDTIKNLTGENFRAGNTSWRKDNIVRVAEMPSGEKRALITRPNAQGHEEVINFFKIGRDYDKFIENLKQFGTPTGIRTQITSLEPKQSNPLTYGDNSIIAKDGTPINGRAGHSNVDNFEGGGTSIDGKPVPEQPQSVQSNSGGIESPASTPKELPSSPQNPLNGTKSVSSPKSTSGQIISQAPLKFNVKNFNISDASKEVIKTEYDAVKPLIEQRVGSRLSNKEVENFTEHTASFLDRTIGRDETALWNTKMLNLRQIIAKEAETGEVTPQFLHSLQVLKTQGTDIARKLQSLSIKAEPNGVTTKQVILEAILKQNDDLERILQASKGVNFNDMRQVTDFYRQFVKPTAGEWIDLLRYNSMLSSPKTHIINAFSNLINTTLVAPVEKTLTGGIDFLSSKFTGKQRNAFTGEGAVYANAYLKNVGDAWNRFRDMVTGKRAMTNLDLRQVPIATKGVKGAVVKGLSLPMRLLEGADQFFTSLAENSQRAVLEYRKMKGGAVTEDITKLAREDAAYRLYRQDLFSKDQGKILDAVDQVTSMVMSLRNNSNPIVSNLAKFTVPFLKTPMNILKQGIEYSPAGFATVPGAKNAAQQVSKALIGTFVFSSAGMLLASDRITGEEPTGIKEKNAWRAGGRQPYSIKLGDKWISYQKLPPAVAFPLAFTAIINDIRKNRKADDTVFDTTLTFFAKNMQFLADQSYAKNFGDLMEAVNGGEYGVAKLVSNYPQQLIPYRALSSWITRLTDDIQRTTDKDGSAIDKQIQLLMMNFPGLSRQTPARLDANGRPIKVQNPFLNAVSPVNVTTEKSSLESFLKTNFTKKESKGSSRY